MHDDRQRFGHSHALAEPEARHRGRRVARPNARGQNRVAFGHGSVSLSLDAISRAATTSRAKASSSAGLYRQCSNTSRRTAPLACEAGVMRATRRPARVTTIVSPPATESRTAEQHRNASEAVISRTNFRLLQSDDVYTRVKRWTGTRALTSSAWATSHQ